MLLFLFLVVLLGSGEWLLQLGVTICEGAYNVTGETEDERKYRESKYDSPDEGMDRD
jgi:hypothetical protein